MTIQRFAEQHRLIVRRDECGDQIILGRRGHLYFDGPDLCLMVTNGPPVNRSRWAALGGKLWMGDISPDKNGRRAQDVKITGIPLESARLAIRLVGAKPRRVMSEAQKAVLDRARSLSPLRVGTHPQPPESIAKGRVAFRVNRRDEEAKGTIQ